MADGRLEVLPYDAVPCRPVLLIEFVLQGKGKGKGWEGREAGGSQRCRQYMFKPGRAHAGGSVRAR